ncbi:MAG: DUF1697 domain-containing protein [Acidimicrobiales bacterium]
MQYIALLRGINVGGHTVRMEHLRGLFREVGLADVRSYIQSGNVFFSGPSADRSVLASRIAGHLLDALGYEVPVFLRTQSELEQVVARDPFRSVVVTPDLRLCVAFTADRIPPLDLPLRSAKNDMAIIDASDYEAFMTWRIVDGRPPVFQSFLTKALQTQLTTRFFPTTAKILEAAKGPKGPTRPADRDAGTD